MKRYGLLDPAFYYLGDESPYLRCVFDAHGMQCDIYIYDDSCELFYGSSHWSAESSDFSSPDELIGDFCDRLELFLATGKPFLP